ADLWTARARMPTARSAMGWGVYNNQYIITAGGEGQDQRFLAAFKSVEAFDATLNRWHVLPSMARQRHGLAVGVVGNRLYAVSGEAQAAGHGLEHASLAAHEALALDMVIKQAAAVAGRHKGAGMPSPRALRFLVGAALAVAVHAPAGAETYPTKPITIVV